MTPPADFDRLAPHYRRLETCFAGPLMQRCRLTHLAAVAGAREILLPGEGPGRFLVEVVRRFPRARITVLDNSPAMLREARDGLERRGLNAARVRFVREDLRAWRPERGRFDLVAVHFLLDCYPADWIAGVAGRLAAVTAPGGRLIHSDFHVPAGWLAPVGRLLLAFLYAAFRLAARVPARRFVEPAPFLEAAGFRRETRRLRFAGLLHSDLWRRNTCPAP